MKNGIENNVRSVVSGKWLILLLCNNNKINFQDILNIGVLIPLLSKHALNLGATHITNGLMGTIVALLNFLSGPIIVIIYNL